MSIAEKLATDFAASREQVWIQTLLSRGYSAIPVDMR